MKFSCAAGAVVPRRLNARKIASSSVSKYRRLDLLVAPARANRKQAYWNPSWLKRYDAAVLQGVDELGQVREQRSRQRPASGCPRHEIG
jgi:hypothetical protein